MPSGAFYFLPIECQSRHVNWQAIRYVLLTNHPLCPPYSIVLKSSSTLLNRNKVFLLQTQLYPFTVTPTRELINNYNRDIRVLLKRVRLVKVIQFRDTWSYKISAFFKKMGLNCYIYIPFLNDIRWTKSHVLINDRR